MNDVALSQPIDVNVIESLALHSVEIQRDDTSCQLMTKKTMDNKIKLKNIMTPMNRVEGLLMKYIIKHLQILLLLGASSCQNTLTVKKIARMAHIKPIALAQRNKPITSLTFPNTSNINNKEIGVLSNYFYKSFIFKKIFKVSLIIINLNEIHFIF